MTEEMKDKEKVSLDMPCRCSDEGRADADALRHDVWTELTEGDSEILVREDSDFVSTVIASLEWDLNTHITFIGMDMWFGIGAENENEKIFVPCDRVEDGLAAIWKYLNDKKVEDK